MNFLFNKINIYIILSLLSLNACNNDNVSGDENKLSNSGKIDLNEDNNSNKSNIGNTKDGKPELINPHNKNDKEDSEPAIEITANKEIDSIMEYAIIYKDKLAGIVGLEGIGDYDNESANIYYWLGNEFWGKWNYHE